MSTDKKDQEIFNRLSSQEKEFAITKLFKHLNGIGDGKIDFINDIVEVILFCKSEKVADFKTKKFKREVNNGE